MTKLHYGWVIVAAGALMTWMAMGALLALPVFLAPISADTGWSRGGIGFAMTLNFLAMGIGSFFWGGLSDRHGPRTILVLDDFYATAFVFGMAYGGVMPLYAALARSYFAPEIMGSVLGGLTLTSGLGMALGPALGGWVFDHFHAYTWMYLGSLAVGLGAAAIALALPRSRTSGPAIALPA